MTTTKPTPQILAPDGQVLVSLQLEDLNPMDATLRVLTALQPKRKRSPNKPKTVAATA